MYFCAYSCPDVYRTGDPDSLCAYVGEAPPETCDRHGGPPVAQREPITDPKITGWLYGDEPTLLDALTDMEAAS